MDFIPCNKCSECEEIASGRSMNVIEIDGASNNGVDAIRELRDTVGYMPSSGKFKLYIIDEVHMLSTSAFNALLKTLEEPPEFVYFVMATTDVHKIPNTVLSRCQRFDFRRIPTRVIAAHLQMICERDGVKFEADALWTIARQGDGSMRDAQSLLDQTINFTNGNLQRDLVVATLGLTDRGLLMDLLSAILHRQTADVVTGLKRLHDSGSDAKLFLLDLMEQVRNTLLLKISGDRSLIDLPDSEQEALIQHSAALSGEDLHLLFDMCLKGAQDLARAADTLLVLEMILLRMANAPRVEQFGAQSSLKAQASRPTVTATETKTATAHSSSQPIHENSAPKPAPQNFAPQKTTTVETAIEHRYKDLVEKIKEVNGLIGAQLENCFVMKLDGKVLTLGIAPKHKFLFDKINHPDFKKKVGNYINSFWGPGFTLNVALGNEMPAGEAPLPSPKALTEKIEGDRQQAIRTAVEAHPLMQSVKSVFKAEIKSIKETKQ